jgi:stalled ribosome rescue protein Dom34
MTRSVARSIPARRADDQAMENFFSSVYQAILRLIPFQSLKAIVIASPGFTKESVSLKFRGFERS